MRTELLSKLYDDFGIDQLPHTQHGITSDRLGKLYEKYILDIFKDIESLKKNSTDVFPQEKDISSKFLNALNYDLSEILKAKIKDRPDLGKDERVGRRVIFELNKSYPVVLAPTLDKEELEVLFLENLKKYTPDI